MSRGGSGGQAAAMATGEVAEARQRPDDRDEARDLLARRYRDERLRADRAEQLCRIVTELNADLNAERQLATLQRVILQLTGLDECWIAIVDGEADTVLLHDASGQDGVIPGRIPQPGSPSRAPTTMWEALLFEGRPILTDDYLAECRRRNFCPVGAQAERPGRAWIGVPLRVGERVIGALAAWRWDGPIDAEVVELLQALAEQSAPALDNARLYARAEQRHREEVAFNAIARDLAGSLDGKATFDHIVRHTRSLLGCDAALITLYDPATDHLHVRGFNADTPEAFVTQVRSDEGMSGYVWRTGRSIIAHDYLNDGRFIPPVPIRDDPTMGAWASAIGMPITLNGERLGVLQASTRERRHFTARDEVILGRLATQAALAVRNARLFAAEQQRAARAEALREIGRDLSANLDLTRLFDSLRLHLKQLTGLASCWVGLCDEAHGARLILWVEDGERRPEAEGPLPLPLPRSMFREVVEAGRSILTADYVRECERRGIPTAGFQADEPNRIWLGLPLQVGGRTIGAMAVWRWNEPIDAESVAALEMLAGQIATALDNARLYEAAEQQRREEAAFNDIARDLAASLDGEILLQRIADHTRALLGVTAARLTLHDPASGLLKVVAGSGRGVERFIGFTSTPEVGMSGIVWRTRRAFSTSNYSDDERFAHIPEFDQWSDERSAQSILGVPILLGDQPLGVLAAIADERREFTTRDEAILGRLATQAALAVRNARLFAAEQQRAARAETLREIGRDLSATLDLAGLLDALQRHLIRLVGPQGFWLGLLDEENACLRMYLWVEEGERRDPAELTRPLPLGPSLIDTVLAEQRAIITDDYAAECRKHGFTPHGPLADQSGRAWGCFPLVVGGKAIGAVTTWHWGSALAPEVCETLELIVGQIATAMENARLYEAAERQRREEATFNAIARDLAASLDGDTLLQRIADHARALFGMIGSLIMLHEPATNLLRVVAGSGERCLRAVGSATAPDVGLTGAVWRTRRPISTANYSDARHFAHNPGYDRWIRERGPRAVLAVPILLGDQALGVLLVVTDERREFTARDEAILIRLANQAALAVHNARLFAEAQERAARLEVLNDIAHQLSAEIDFERFLNSVWGHLGRITRIAGCWLALWHEQTEELQFCLYVEDGERRPEWEQSIARSSGEGLAWAVLQGQATLRVADYTAECHRRGLIPKGSDPERPNAPWLGIPLVVNGRITGAMALWRREVAFADEETATLGTLANQIAATLENARLYQEARTLAVTDPLTGLLNHRNMQERLDQEIARAARHGRSLAVVMIDLDNFKLFNDTYGHPAGDQILRATAAILRAEARDTDVIARYGGDEFCLILPETTHEGALALVERVQTHCRSIGIRADTAQFAGHRPGGTIPLRVSAGIAVYPRDAKDRHELVTRADGALYANKRGGRPLAAPDHAAGEESGMALVSNASFGVIEGLVLAVDAKDHYTVAHSQVVADAAVLLARALQLPEHEVATLRTAGLLHDVGKVSIPDRILRKPGQLTEDEWQVMRQHVEFSELIIRGAPGLQEILEPVMHHHERWDGRGYPRGLAGEAVPLLGRIMIVADAYSAMTLDRPYRRGLSVSEALGQLRAGAGNQFDPGLVAIFCEAIAGGGLGGSRQ
ncbi:MAG: GAF domain-containing protein [Thermomicrobiales bacterium]